MINITTFWKQYITFLQTNQVLFLKKMIKCCQNQRKQLHFILFVVEFVMKPQLQVQDLAGIYLLYSAAFFSFYRVM